MKSFDGIWAIFALMFGCCSNVFFLEHLIKMSSNSGNVIIFFQYVFTAVEGLITYSKFGKTKRIIPLKDYVVVVFMFVVVTLTNIISLNCNIPIPLHTVFKSGSLVANLVIGSIVLKRSYSFSKYLSVIIVTIGIFICTFATSISKISFLSTSNEKEESLLLILLGVILLSISLVTSARLGVYQEVLFSRYGKQSREAVFYCHILPLPFFVLMAPSIIANIRILNASDLYQLPVVTELYTHLIGDPASMTSIPILWMYMIGNLITQYICISSVFYLTSVFSSLTVTLLMTLRKFLSLVISVFYFKNHFSQLHWLGASFVFIGTLVYADIFSVLNLIRKSSALDNSEEMSRNFIKESKKEKVS